MRRRLTGVVVVAMALVTVPMTSVTSAAPGKVGSYIVVLHDNVPDPGAVARTHARSHSAAVGFVYSHALKGYSATIPEVRIPAVRSDPRVRYVEAEGEARVTAQTVPLGITQVGATLSSTLAGDGTGAVNGVDVYVLDTGIDPTHTDLNVVSHVNFGGGSNADCSGHGTHVAGTVGAEDNVHDVVGVAPGVRLHGVKVLGCHGQGGWSRVIKGIDWITANRGPVAVVNVSLSGSPSQALDDAIRRSASNGVVYVVAAGNEGGDACAYSPARAGTAEGIITVAAVEYRGLEVSYSNYGACVDIWAPGTGVLSTAVGGGTATRSGTSMAAPHVAGGAALWLSRSPSTTPAAVEGFLRSSALPTGALSKDGRPIVRLDVGTF